MENQPHTSLCQAIGWFLGCVLFSIYIFSTADLIQSTEFKCYLYDNSSPI